MTDAIVAWLRRHPRINVALFVLVCYVLPVAYSFLRSKP